MDIFLELLRRVFKLKPGMEASTSRIVDACVSVPAVDVVACFPLPALWYMCWDVGNGGAGFDAGFRK